MSGFSDITQPARQNSNPSLRPLETSIQRRYALVSRSEAAISGKPCWTARHPSHGRSHRAAWQSGTACPATQLDKTSVPLRGSVYVTCVLISDCVGGHPAVPFACPVVPFRHGWPSTRHPPTRQGSVVAASSNSCTALVPAGCHLSMLGGNCRTGAGYSRDTVG